MPDNDVLLNAVSETLQYTGVKLRNPHTFSIEKGKIYAVVGENGSGKTTLGKIIEKGWNISTNKILGDKKSLHIKSIEFTDIHSLTGCSDSYYQQRFESTANDSIPTVGQLIDGKIDDRQWLSLCKSLSIDDVRHKRVNFLSSGELRKFLIINMLIDNPDIIIIDNPYIGLDSRSRQMFNDMIARLAENGRTIILLLCNTRDIPDFTNCVIPIQNLEIGKPINVTPQDIASLRDELKQYFSQQQVPVLPLNSTSSPADYVTAFELSHCNVAYGKNIILHDVSWKVSTGEKWALLGENGAGKSTLLSLVYADNPQGYRNDITLFDRKRGTGESIWDIKKRIGYISPEMHLYFNNGEDVLTVVASGLHDNIGCFRRINDEQKAIASQWLDTFGLGHLATRYFRTLSSGEQRLVLLARTFAKRAPLLILDEPLHGLDMMKKQLVSDVIGQIMKIEGMTLVYVTHYEHEIPSAVNHIFRLAKSHVS